MDRTRIGATAGAGRYREHAQMVSGSTTHLAQLHELGPVPSFIPPGAPFKQGLRET